MTQALKFYPNQFHTSAMKNLVWLSLTHSPSKRFTCCIYKSSLVVIGLQLFKKLYQFYIFPPNLTSDDPWPWYMTPDLINIQKNPHCIFDPSLVLIRFQLFKGDPNNVNQHSSPNLTSNDIWQRLAKAITKSYQSFYLINIWRNLY